MWVGRAQGGAVAGGEPLVFVAATGVPVRDSSSRCGQLEASFTTTRRMLRNTSHATLINRLRQVHGWPSPSGSSRRRRLKKSLRLGSGNTSSSNASAGGGTRSPTIAESVISTPSVAVASASSARRYANTAGRNWPGTGVRSTGPCTIRVACWTNPVVLASSASLREWFATSRGFVPLNRPCCGSRFRRAGTIGHHRPAVRRTSRRTGGPAHRAAATGREWSPRSRSATARAGWPDRDRPASDRRRA